jgi:LPS biosynthesis protein
MSPRGESMKLSTFETLKNLRSDSEQLIRVDGETLVRYQETLLHMAEDIIAVCEEKKIYYQLSGGTVLGAVRHGGFIPWDDDIDLNIRSGDMKRLADALRERYGDRYHVQNCYDPEYGNVTGKVRLRGSVARSRDDVGMKECGFAIDLFPIENYFDNPLLYWLHGVLCMGTGFLLSCRRFYENREFYRKLEDGAPEVRKTFERKIFIGSLISFLSVRRWSIITNACYSLCRNRKTKRVGIPSGRGHYFKETYSREGMIRRILANFEGHRWAIPKDYKDYLRKLYGRDYMTLPPEEKREKHFLLELQFPEDD